MVTTRAISSGAQIPPLYTGHVGCRTRIADSLNAGITSFMTGRAEFAREDLTSLTLVYGNFYATTTGEASPGAVRTIAADIEYPAGVFTRVTFGGANSVVMADGATQVPSDAITVNIPKGAQYWINTYQQSAAGIIFYLSVLSSDVLLDHSSQNAADLTCTAWTGLYGAVANFGPYAILATTRSPCVATIGDSLLCNTGGTSGKGVYGGLLSPGIAPFLPVLDLSRGGQWAQHWAEGGGAKRATYLDYATHGIIELGVNDYATLRTAAQVIANRQTIRGLKPSLKWFQTTITPRATSSDSWVTLTNQTTNTYNAVRIAINEQVRGGMEGFVGYIELADALESARNSGIFKAPPMTPAAIVGDVVHPNDAGYALTRPYVNPAVFVR